jgi:hypothetical protein
MIESITDKQKKDYAKVNSLRPMSFERFIELNIKLNSYFDCDKYIISYIDDVESFFHRNLYLECYDNYSYSKGRCLTKGTEKWRRKDMSPLTKSDEDAIKLLYLGQSNKFDGGAGDLYIDYTWIRDSSD